MKEHNPKIDYTHISKNHQYEKPKNTFHYHFYITVVYKYIIVNSIYTLWLYIPSIEKRGIVYVYFQTLDQKRSIGSQNEV